MTSRSNSGNNSLQSWHSRRCDFCLYHDLIFDQLQRLKQATIMKNQRIKELQDFIAKMSQMTFIKNPIMNFPSSIQNSFAQKDSSINQERSNQISFGSQNDFKKNFMKKKLDQSEEITFQDVRMNNEQFQLKKRQTPDFMSRFQKIKELNELKRQLDKQISQTADKQNNSERISSLDNSRNFQTMKTLSEPQQQGFIGQIGRLSIENSRLRQIYPEKIKLQDFVSSLNSEKDIAINKSLKKSNSFEDISSINFIKQYVKNLN